MLPQARPAADARPKPLPAGIRLVRPGDEARLFDLLLTAYRDNGVGHFNADTVRGIIAEACAGQRICMAIIDGPERIEAIVGLQPCRPWHGTDEDWYWTELMVFVHPWHRRTRHAQRLMEFVAWFAETMHTRVAIYVHPRERLGSKIKFFARFGRLVGACFMFGESGR